MLRCKTKYEHSGGGQYNGWFLHGIDTSSGVKAMILKDDGNLTCVAMDKVFIDMDRIVKPKLLEQRPRF